MQQKALSSRRPRENIRPQNTVPQADELTRAPWLQEEACETKGIKSERSLQKRARRGNSESVDLAEHWVIRGEPDEHLAMTQLPKKRDALANL
jgi:hypothetical protein